METLANLESFVRSAETAASPLPLMRFCFRRSLCPGDDGMSDFYKPSTALPRARAACEGLRIRFDEGFAETLPSMSVRGEVRTTEVPFRTTDSGALIVAVRQGLGMTMLPCFVGNADPLLVRMLGTDLRMHGALWLRRRSA
jgi:DNA-binding transcriptional LysR family regulator